MKIPPFMNHVPAVCISLIFVQSLFFKFSGSPESVFIFTTIGLEPWGRYLVGFGELIASVLLILPVTRVKGAIMSLMIIIPALLFHLTSLGIVVQNDGGLLFGLALLIMVLALVQLIFLREKK